MKTFVLQIVDCLRNEHMHNVVLERQNAPIHPVEHEVSVLEHIAPTLPNTWLELVNARHDPPPLYTREPAARSVSDWGWR